VFWLITRSVPAFVAILYLVICPIFWITYFSKVGEKFGIALLVPLLAFTLPIQLSNGISLYFATIYGEALVKAIEGYREKGIGLPKSAKDFPLVNPSFFYHIVHYTSEQNDFVLCYFVTDPSTQYCYSSKHGWTYDDD
jgi:hypothetical protein